MFQQDQRLKMEEYLDGVLSTDQQSALEVQLTSDPRAARMLARLKADRALRAAVYDSYKPTALESSRLTQQFLAEAHAPVGRIGPWLEMRRLVGIAAAIAVLIGTFAVGRMTATAPTPDDQQPVAVTYYKVVYVDAGGIQRESEPLTEDQLTSYIDKLKDSGSTIVLADYLPAGHM